MLLWEYDSYANFENSTTAVDQRIRQISSGKVRFTQKDQDKVKFLPPQNILDKKKLNKTITETTADRDGQGE